MSNPARSTGFCYPVLHHMAEHNSWPHIQELGLRTTEQLVDACQPDDALRAEILTQRRSRSYELIHPVVGPVVVRDQKPLLLHNLALTDVTLEGFLALLNDRVFMWTHPSRLAGLLGAYGANIHDVLVVDTERLVEAYYDDVRLTGINTGATIFPNSPARGSDTFKPIAEFPFQERRRGRNLANTVVELCVIGGVDFVEDFVIRVERRQGDVLIETVYER